MFEPVAKAWALDGTPRDSAFAVLPPDWDRLAPFLEVAMRRFPALEDAGIRTLFCGPESFTDDLSPMWGSRPRWTTSTSPAGSTRSASSPAAASAT